MTVNLCGFSGMSGLLSNCQRHFGILLELGEVNQDASRVEVEMPASVSCCDSDLAVCIDFPGESGIVSW